MTHRMKAISQAVSKSAPNPDRPRLPEEYERALHDSDRERAACYAQLEDVTDRLKEVADGLNVEPDRAVPIEIEADEETSLVTAVAAIASMTQ